jgi:DNA-binding FadR family transcriptional regulator
VSRPADVLALERVLQANKQAIGDLVRFQQTDVAFHLAIASIPRNPIYLAPHEAIVVGQRAAQRGAAPARHRRTRRCIAPQALRSH